MNKQLPIGVLDEHPTWLQPLYDALTQRGASYRKMDVSADSYPIELPDLLPLYVNRLSMSSHTRGHANAYRYSYDMLRHLESFGAKVINGSHTLLLDTSKAAQMSFLHQHKFPYPKTVCLNAVSKIEHYLDAFDFPVLIKPNCGGSGAGIQKFDSAEQLHQAITDKKLEVPRDDVFLLQKFIPAKDNHIVRVETVNKKMMYAMKVITSGETFNLCASDECDVKRVEDVEKKSEELGYCSSDTSGAVKFELYDDPPGEIVAAIEDLVEKADLDCAGIEYLYDEQGNWFIFEINGLSVLRASFKEEYGVDGWGMMADYFVEEYKKIVN